ncbi:MAG: hypothetical protein EXR92_00760 [Gemmatimonadetes bacterium]|nr:hypothetical protein [Gemmatimonadota bacterium]
MIHRNNPKPARVREPVQVYLDGSSQERLERLTGLLDATKSDVLRRGLEALEREMADPERHPALRIIGICSGPVLWSPDYDVALEHDRALADTEEASWGRDETSGV